ETGALHAALALDARRDARGARGARRRREGAGRRPEPDPDAQHAPGRTGPPRRRQRRARAGHGVGLGLGSAGRRARPAHPGPARRRRRRRCTAAAPGALAGGAPGRPQPGDDRRQPGARRPVGRDDRRARPAGRQPRAAQPHPHAHRGGRRVLPRPPRGRPAARRAGGLGHLPGPAAALRHGLPRGRPPARRLRGLRGGGGGDARRRRTGGARCGVVHLDDADTGRRRRHRRRVRPAVGRRRLGGRGPVLRRRRRPRARPARQCRLPPAPGHGADPAGAVGSGGARSYGDRRPARDRRRSSM
ncbi:MAG: Molybdopterin dehydrogenase, FAD-binding subunit, partial [uncultured Frankineae bacterium]